MSEAKPPVTFTIDGKKVTVPAGTLVIEAAKQAGVDIPHYCYHPALGNPGNCRLCVVEVEGAPKPQVSCRVTAQEGMVVKADSPAAKRARAGSLEFHLVNHPLDCPVCDQAGECWLQDYYMQIGLYTSQVREDKLHKDKRVPIGKTIMLDQERCILCTRCTRFTDNVTKTHELGIFNRGDREVLSTAPGRTVDDNAYSGNLADVCPVGALTDRDFRFKVRVWYLRSTPSVCDGCSRGCAIDMHTNSRLWHTQGARVARYKPRVNPEVNGWWLCDEGRYSYGKHDKDRYSKVRRRRAGGWEPLEWRPALEHLAGELRRLDGKLGLVLTGGLSNEDLYLARALFHENLGVRMAVFGPEPEQLGEEDALLRRREKVPNLKGAELLGFGTKVGKESWEGLADGLASGRIRGLWVAGRDPAAVWGGKAAGLLKDLELAVYQGPARNAFAEEHAGWILPAATHAEEDGTFTNFQGRVQRFHKAFAPLGQARPEWEVWHELLGLLGGGQPFRSAQDCFDGLARSEKAFAGLSFDALGPNGAPAHLMAATQGGPK